MEALKRLEIVKRRVPTDKNDCVTYQIEWEKYNLKDRGEFWGIVIEDIVKQFNYTDDCLVFIAPFHQVRYLGDNLREELSTLSEKSKFRKIGIIDSQDYLFMSSTIDFLVKSVIPDYYDHALKIFFSQKKNYDWNIFLEKLDGVPIEELQYDLRFADGILEILYPAGRQAFLTVGNDK